MQFKLWRKPTLQIVDEKFGYGFVVEGQVDGKAHIAVIDYNLCESTCSILAEVFKDYDPVPVTVDIHPQAKKLVYADTTRAFKRKVYEHLLTYRYQDSVFSDRQIKEIACDEAVDVFIPRNSRLALQEDVRSTIKNKIKALFYCSGIGESTIYQVSISETLNKDRPFCLTRINVNEGFVSLKKIEENFWKIFPGSNLSRLIKEEKTVAIGFAFAESFIRNITDFERPIFPSDPIDEYCSVEFDFPEKLNNAMFEQLKFKVMETGAAVAAYKTGIKQVVLEIPCSSLFGGTVGAAFESRYIYTVGLMEKIFEANPTTELKETKMLSESFDSLRNQVKRMRLVECIASDNFACFKKLITVKNSEMPFLFEEASGNEVFFLCEEGNYLAAKKTGDEINIYHGVVQGKSSVDVTRYYPALLEVGGGEMR